MLNEGLRGEDLKNFELRKDRHTVICRLNRDGLVMDDRSFTASGYGNGVIVTTKRE